MTLQNCRLFCLLALCLLAPSSPVEAVPAPTGAPVVVRGGGGEAGFDPLTGRIVFLRRGGVGDTPALARTPPTGDLWTLGLRGGETIRASTFLKDRPLAIHRLGPQAERLVYGSAGGATVTVDVVGSARGLDLHLSVQGLPDDVLDAGLPADLTFDPAGLRRVLFPEHLGIALMPSFFRPHAQAVSWDRTPVGPEGLRRVAGLDLRAGAGNAAPVTVSATPLGQQILGADLAGQWASAPRAVTRPPVQTPDVPLLTSSAGSFLGGHRVGTGLLVRIGGTVRAEDGPLVIKSTERLMAAAARSPQSLGLKSQRSRVVLVALAHGPARGSWSDIAISEWQERLSHSPELTAAGVQLSIADSVEALQEALQDGKTLAVVNPYGEDFPGGDDWGAMLDHVHGYLAAGGLWFECGGYSFYSGMKANPFVSLEDHYPSRAFSDFGRIESTGGAVSLSGVQNAHDAGRVFVPAAWVVSGGLDGGHLQRRWQTFLPKGSGGQTPPVRLRFGDTDAGAALRTYAKTNGLDRALAAKMSPRLLEIWKRSVLFKLDTRQVSEETSLLERLPAPAIVHLVAYLHGGFDRQYPDHLPPRADYGTAEQFKQLIALAHRKHFLVMPYTNTTWWPDNPKGPTFEQAGDAPLLVRLDGQHNHEVYGPESSGWTISPFHPAVTASLDRLVEQFTRDYPVDILFQDQNGARGLLYDLNAASPTPYADTQGLINLAGRAAVRLPVATEDGFDYLLNAESEFCGLTQELIAFPYSHDARLSDRLPDGDWQFFPMAQYVAHDKAFFLNHDLGPGVADRDALLWSLALGYGLSRAVNPAGASDDGQMHWISELARLQASLGPHYMGAPLTGFRYLRGSGSRGVIAAMYGDLRLIVNLTDRPYTSGGSTVAPHDFSAHAPGMATEHLAQTDTP